LYKDRTKGRTPEVKIWETAKRAGMSEFGFLFQVNFRVDICFSGLPGLLLQHQVNSLHFSAVDL